MALLSVKNVDMSFGGPKLLDGASFQIEAGQRVCLVGRNGEGKSTLLRLLSGDLVPDAGEISRSQGMSVARLSQKVPELLEGTVFEVVTAGLGELGKSIAEYHRVCGSNDLSSLPEIESSLEEQGGWEALNTVEMVISRLSLDPLIRFETLSGGLKRRALLARALAGNPDVLLLDEPTNHLDIDSIAWLEEFLLRHVKTLIFITHDRMFLRRVADRIIELDRGQLADWSCDYDTFLKRKADLLAAQEKQWAEFDKKLAREEVWIRQGIQARRTRNEGRVRALKQMRCERTERRERQGRAKITMQEAKRSGKMVAEAQDVSFAWPGKEPVFQGLKTTIMRGDRVGLIGPNGAGKTTLIQVLLGRLKPSSGAVRLGTNLEIAYFDQHREELDPAVSVRDSIAYGSDQVTINGCTKHVMGYLKDFLFTADRANSLVSVLSGGERNRLLLARLFTRPSNLLVMDEPTNDLDAETLELLEDQLLDYCGTVIIVSHDRAFLNNVVTSTIVLDGSGSVAEYVGGYDDWLRQRPELEETKKQKPALPKARPGLAAPRKLTFNEQRELKDLGQEQVALPLRIEELEKGIEAQQAKMALPDFYKGTGPAIAEAKQCLATLEGKLQAAFERWEVVEARLEELGSDS